MADVLALRYSRTFPAEVGRAYDETLAAPLPGIFDRRYLLISPITEVRDQPEPWGSVGQTRTIVQADGGTMHEQLTEVVPGRHFGYHLDRVTGPLAALVDHVDGRWAFERAGTGVRVTWTWEVALRGPQAAVVAPVLRPLWRGFARQGFERLEQLLVPPA
ncbi:SRPBCC family protein [Nocardioides aequoreus]|uniref:SRPBCC family protein n=1 Tax=Nocardioides aequoreus TaxID=397278 RepID=UPI0004C428EB|nr:SRPBCC family protein [Nocardioides aequoreus]